MRIHDVSGLQVSQDLAYEHRAWAIQRIAWVVIAAGLLAAALGLLGGNGPLMTATAASEGMTVHYDRFARIGVAMQLDVEVAGGELAVARDWLERYSLERVVPEPETVTATGDRYVYELAVRGPGLVRLELVPRRLGRHEAALWGPAGQRVEFSQLVYP